MSNPVARTVKDFCRAYGIGASKTYELIRNGKLQTVKVGTRTLITESSAQTWWSDVLAASTSASTFDARIVARNGAQRRIAKAGILT